jgi:DNA replication protein DnaC
MFADAEPLHFRLNVDTRQRLQSGLSYYIGSGTKWIPAYDTVATWLADNQGRGLICVGTCGLGKSVICEKVVPVLLKGYLGIDAVAVTAVDMNRRIDELLQYCGHHRIIIIDDLGTEPPETVHYGNRRKPFCELVDRASRTGTLLIISTNLRTNMQRLKEDCREGRAGDPMPGRVPSIEERYGVPTLDRLRATTRTALFRGDSMRH